MTDPSHKRIEGLRDESIVDILHDEGDAFVRRRVFDKAITLASELAEKLRAFESGRERLGTLLVSPAEAVRSYAAQAAQAAKEGDVSEGLHAIGHLETVGWDAAVALVAEQQAHAETKRELAEKLKSSETERYAALKEMAKVRSKAQEAQATLDIDRFVGIEYTENRCEGGGLFAKVYRRAKEAEKGLAETKRELEQERERRERAEIQLHYVAEKAGALILHIDERAEDCDLGAGCLICGEPAGEHISDEPCGELDEALDGLEKPPANPAELEPVAGERCTARGCVGGTFRGPDFEKPCEVCKGSGRTTPTTGGEQKGGK